MLKIRKLLSMVLVVAIFASMCAVSFGQLGTAASSSTSVIKPVTTVYNFKTDKTGESAYSDTSLFKGKTKDSYLDTDGFHLVSKGTAASLYHSWDVSSLRDMVILRDTDSSISGSDGTLTMQANKLYSVTVKYKVTQYGSNTYLGFAIVDSDNESAGYIEQALFSAKITSNSTSFVTHTCVIDSDRAVAQKLGGTHTIAGRKLAIMYRNPSYSDTEVLIESVTVTVVDKGSISNERYYNFVDDATGNSCYDDNTGYVSNYVKYDTLVDKTEKSYVDTDGLHLYTPLTGSNSYYDRSVVREMAVIADPDVAISDSDGALVAKANKEYTLTVKYLVENYGGDLNGVCVGFAIVGTQNNKAGYLQQSYISDAIVQNMTEYQTFTLTIDADTLVADNVDGADTTIAGRKIAVIARQASHSATRVLVQSVTVVEKDKTTLVSDTYTYNFINDSTKESAYAAGTTFVTNYIDYNTANKENKSYVDDEGLHYYNSTNTSNAFDKCSVRNRALIYDTDVRDENAGSILVAQPGKIYTLTIKYRIDNYGGDRNGVSVGFGICGKTNDKYVYINKDLTNFDTANEMSAHLANKTRFETLTKVIDADTVVADTSGTTSPIAGRKIAVIMRQASGRACQMTIESVTVKVADKSEMKYINLNDGKTTLSTVQGAVGETVALTTPTKDGYIFAGWTQNFNYSNCANRYGEEYTYSTVTPANYHTFTDTDATVDSEETAVTYYALWAKQTVEFCMGEAVDGKYLLNDTAAKLTTAQTNGAWVENIDGEYVLRYNYSDNNTHYTQDETTTLKLTKDNTVHLRQGVTYRLSLDLKQETNRIMAIALSRGCDGANSNYRKVVGLSDNATDGFTQIFWRAANTVKDWTTYSVTFTADKLFDTTKAPDGLLRDVLTLRFLKGAGYIKNIKLEAISYTPEVTVNLNHTDGGDVEVDYENRQVIVNVNDGYTLSSDNVYLTYNYHTAEGDIWNSKGELAELNGKNLSLTYDALNSTNKRLIYSFNNLFETLHTTTPDGICVNVNFTSETTKNAIRYEKTVDNEYISAGLRFRYRMDYATTQKATDIGFILLPQQLATSDDWYIIQSTGKPLHRSAQVAYVKGGDLTKEIWYASDKSTYKDYQLICTGLTRQGVAGNLLDTPFTAVMFAKIDDEYVYYPVGTQSYTTVSNKYIYAGQNGLGGTNGSTLTLTAEDLVNYQIVLPKYNVSYLVVREAEILRDKIKTLTGVELPIVRDSAATTDYEIVIDNCTNRKGVPAVDEYDKYQIKCRDNKVFICGGRNYSTVSGIQALVEMISANGSMIVENVIGEYNSSQAEYKLKWSDEFEGTKYNESWSLQDGVESSLGGWYDRTVYRSKAEENVYAADGKLHQAATYDNKHFYGVFMTTSRSIIFTYGFTEISAKLADGDSLWHCFWVWDQGIGNSGELLEFDVMECWSQSQLYGNVIHETIGGVTLPGAINDNTKHSYVTIDGAYKNDDASFWTGPKQNREPEYLMSEQFHTFALLWDEEKAAFYRDGICTLESNYVGQESEPLYKNPHYLILSFAPGTNKGGYPDDIDPTAKVFATNKKPDLYSDCWTNGKNIFTIEYIQLFQKDGWYLR